MYLRSAIHSLGKTYPKTECCCFLSVLQMQEHNPARQSSLLVRFPRSALSVIAALEHSNVFTVLSLSSSLSCCFCPRRAVPRQQQLPWLPSPSQSWDPPTLQQLLTAATSLLPTALGFSGPKGSKHG